MSGSPPGIFGRVTARKNKYRSINSPPVVAANERTAEAVTAPLSPETAPTIASAGRTTPPAIPRNLLRPAGRFKAPRSSQAVRRKGRVLVSLEAVARLEPELGHCHDDQRPGDERNECRGRALETARLARAVASPSTNGRPRELDAAQ